jgi:hypothetical protein
MLVKVCERNSSFDIYPLRISSRKNSKKTKEDRKHTHTHTQKGTELFNVISGVGEEKKNKELSEYCNGTKFCVTPKPITFFFLLSFNWLN